MDAQLSVADLDKVKMRCEAVPSSPRHLFEHTPSQYLLVLQQHI
jgi:hypothetical protein